MEEKSKRWCRYALPQHDSRQRTTYEQSWCLGFASSPAKSGEPHVPNCLGHNQHFPSCPAGRNPVGDWAFHLMQFSFLRTICSRGLRLKTWDHALSHPSCHSSRLLYNGFCWTAVSCEPLTLGTHTDRILNYQLLHSPKHDLHVLGGKGLLGVECKEGAVTFSAIRPFTNHHWPLEGAQPNMESREWVGMTLPFPCPTPPPKQSSFSTPEAQSAHWIAMPACQWWSPECAQLKALPPRYGTNRSRLFEPHVPPKPPNQLQGTASHDASLPSHFWKLWAW